MSLTLPVEFKATPGSLEAELRKASAEAIKQAQAVQKATEQAAKDAAAAQAKAIKYVSDLRAKALADDQRARAAELVQEEKFAGALDSLRQSMAGVSSEQQKLNELSARAAELYARGSISAADYAAATADIAKRGEQLKDQLAHAKSGISQLGAATNVGGMSLMKMAGALSIVDPALGELARNLGDAADVGEVAATAGETLGLSLGTVAAVAVPLAIAIGAVAWELRESAKAAELAKKNQEALAAAMSRATKANQSFADTVRDYQERQSIATGTIDQLTAKHNAERLELQKVTKERYGAAKALLDEAEAQFKAAGVTDTSTKAYRDARLPVEQARANLQQLAESSKQAAAEFEITAAAEVAAAQATAERKEDVRATADALKQLTKSQEAQLKSLLNEADAEKKRSDTLEKSLDTLHKAHAAALQGIATEEERIRMAAQAAREAAAGAAAEAQAAATSSAQRKAIALELRETLDAINQGEVADLQAAEAAKTAAAKQAADQRAADAEAAAKATADAIAAPFSAISGGLSDVAGMVANAIVPGIGAAVSTLVTFTQNARESFSGLLEELLAFPKQLKDLVPAAADFVVAVVEQVPPAFMEAIPDIVQALVESVLSPEFIAAIVKMNAMIFNPATGVKIGIQIARGLWDSFVAGWKKFASGEMIDDFREALLWGAVSFVATIRDYFEELVQKLKDLLTPGSGTAGKVGDTIKEVVTLGQADTKTYSDSPGPVRMSRRTTVRVDPGDWVDVAKQRERLGGGGGGSGGGWTATTVDLAAGHLALDQQVRRLARQPRNSRELRGLTGARAIRGIS